MYLFGSEYSTRVIQHYTSNPLMAYTGKLDTPLIKISYNLRGGQHIGQCDEESIVTNMAGV